MARRQTSHPGFRDENFNPFPIDRHHVEEWEESSSSDESSLEPRLPFASSIVNRREGSRHGGHRPACSVVYLHQEQDSSDDESYDSVNDDVIFGIMESTPYFSTIIPDNSCACLLLMKTSWNDMLQKFKFINVVTIMTECCAFVLSKLDDNDINDIKKLVRILNLLVDLLRLSRERARGLNLRRFRLFAVQEIKDYYESNMYSSSDRRIRLFGAHLALEEAFCDLAATQQDECNNQKFPTDSMPSIKLVEKLQGHKQAIVDARRRRLAMQTRESREDVVVARVSELVSQETYWDDEFDAEAFVDRLEEIFSVLE